MSEAEHICNTVFGLAPPIYDARLAQRLERRFYTAEANSLRGFESLTEYHFLFENSCDYHILPG